MNRLLSQKMRFYSFVCISLLLFVHGYNLKQTYLQPFSLVNEPTTFTTFFEYYIANGLLRFRIPLLFCISGYIYAVQDNRPYLQRIGKRFKTLLLPYFIWSAIGLLITFILQQFPSTAQAVFDAQIDQLGDNRPYSEMPFTDILFRWVLSPPSFQLWFIRSLFLYNILYPLFRWLTLKVPQIWFVFLFIAILLNAGIFFLEAQGMFFFCAGIFFAKKNIPIDRKPAWLSSYLCWLFFLGLAFIKTWMAFEFDEYQWPTVILMNLLHYVSVIAGLLAVWFSLDDLVRWCMRQSWFLWIVPFSFFIYGLHVPLLPYLTRFMYNHLEQIRYYRLITFFAAPLIIWLGCIAAGAFLRKIWPAGYRFITGGRGF